MNKHVVAILFLLAVAESAIASPEIIELKNRIKFKHKAHMALVGTCSKCHVQGVGKIAGFGKEWAHKNCKGCHVEMGKGPIKCSGCHKWSD
jgi:hypothetical protein